MRTRSKYFLILFSAMAAAALGYVFIYQSWPLLNSIFLYLPGLDKAVHFLAGAAIWWGIFWYQSLFKNRASPAVRAVIAFSVTIVIIAADEFAQSFTVTRTVDLKDPLSGAAGSALGFVLSGISRRRIGVAIGVLAFSILFWTTYSTYERNHYYFEAMRLERETRYEEAYELYKMALIAAPDMAGIYNSIAWLCLEYLERDYDKALGWAQKGVQLNPDDPVVRDTLGWAYYKNGQLDQALEEVSAAASQSPENPAIRRHWEVLRVAIAGRSPPAGPVQ